ncbi:MAG: 30S ribosomal protein S5 [Candidatus Aenigmarchaeota archaeon]|nr:30S ribosomal protein S5 [Candidatus Aenigmarchaeota archaeon]MDI6722957.1 30S ribosomal protein S5 [Candidatus Aenigmarchaeota archaeon]
MNGWIPRTELGKQVAAGEISIDEIFKTGRKIKEPEIVDKLLPGLQSEIIYIGGSPGKGGGIKRTSTKRTARMHRSGRRYKVSALAVVGDGNGYIGIGSAQSKENRDAIDKAVQDAKLNIMPVKRGCGSWECRCDEGHSVPVKVVGSKGSDRVMLIPAPKGIGLCINDEAKKVLKLAGIRDIWSKSFGETRTRTNYILAMFNAFKKMNRMKIEAVERKSQIRREDTEEAEDAAATET